MVTGAKLILEEREEQIYKHGWSLHNDQSYDRKQLVFAALSCLAHDQDIQDATFLNPSALWPYDWIRDPYYFNIAHRKTYIQRLVIAGALIAAEIDRNLLLEREEEL